MLLPRKLRSPIDTCDRRKEVLERSAFMTDKASETIVPLPTVVRYGDSCPSSVPKFDPVCWTCERLYPSARR